MATTLSTGVASGPPEESVKIPILKQSLQAIFSQYGTILDIVAKKSLRAKGQAFVVFDSTDAAENAIREVQAFPLFNKPMVLAFARTRSDATVKRECGEESREFEAHKRRRLAEKERKQAQLAHEAQRRPAAAAPADKAPKKPAGLKSTAPAAAPQIPDEYLPPNTTLFLRDLPDDTESETLGGLFSRFDSFKEVRMVPGRKGIAFVEFETLEGAISAKEGMGGMVLGNNVVKVTYQRQ
ncbi:U1 small nuclear ribonucleo protein [Sphaerosporella brunnea]|uniref:U1 small nuclear ribonucleo protein n=1 Tax=Sphaerosporella brunnea TaxID=1250544 RepID=A0A5J5EML6_9PEZI|nr:U1 small nuclear ribonucleo protein [Sphaerosporella brunnea]